MTALKGVPANSQKGRYYPMICLLISKKHRRASRQWHLRCLPKKSTQYTTGSLFARACRRISYRSEKIRCCVFYVPRRGRNRLRGSALVPTAVDSSANRGTSAPVNPARGTFVHSGQTRVPLPGYRLQVFLFPKKQEARLA